jgi:hypothetical protein
LSCFEAQKELFSSLKNSFLEAVAGSENSLKHCKNHSETSFCVSQTALKTLVSEYQKEMFLSLKKARTRVTF